MDLNHKKESPVQGMTGLWGGVGSNLVSGSPEDPGPWIIDVGSYGSHDDADGPDGSAFVWLQSGSSPAASTPGYDWGTITATSGTHLRMWGDTTSDSWPIRLNYEFDATRDWLFQFSYYMRPATATATDWCQDPGLTLSPWSNYSQVEAWSWSPVSDRIRYVYNCNKIDLQAQAEPKFTQAGDGARAGWLTGHMVYKGSDDTLGFWRTNGQDDWDYSEADVDPTSPKSVGGNSNTTMQNNFWIGIAADADGSAQNNVAQYGANLSKVRIQRLD